MAHLLGGFSGHSKPTTWRDAIAQDWQTLVWVTRRDPLWAAWVEARLELWPRSHRSSSPARNQSAPSLVGERPAE